MGYNTARIMYTTTTYTPACIMLSADILYVYIYICTATQGFVYWIY